MRFTSSSGSPCQIMATLSRVLVFRCRSRQFTLKLSSPSLNQSKVFACSSQNFSGSRMERSYIASNCAALRCARFTTSGDGGNVRPSCCSDSVEMVLLGICLVKLISHISAKTNRGVNHVEKKQLGNQCHQAD